MNMVLKMDFKFIWMIRNSDNLNIIGCFTDKVAAENAGGIK